jgi:hypothetical protein
MEISPELVGLHDTNNSELCVLTASVSTLPHLEATNAKRVLNEEKKKKRREAIKLKREAREKKKEEQRLEEKKARKEERRLKREARIKRREARNKKGQEAKASNASSSELSSSSEDGDDDESYQVHIKKEKKEKGKKNDNNKYVVVSFNYSSMSMTNHDRKSFINMPADKLHHFDGTNFIKWKHLMRAYVIGLHLDIWEVVFNGFEPLVDPKNPTMEEMRIIHLNGQATSVILSALDGDEYNRVIGVDVAKQIWDTLHMKGLTK